MDPARLCLAVAAVYTTIDDRIQYAYKPTSTTLALIKSQIKLLETGLQRIQQWQWHSDPTTRGQVYSLSDAILVVHDSVQKLQVDLGTVQSGLKTAQGRDDIGSDASLKTRLERHLIDIRECVSLLNFTLNVCQLPVGPGAKQEIKELELSAKTLHRAHIGATQDRRRIINDQKSSQDPRHSENFNNFLNSVIRAEDDFPEGRSLSRQNSWGSSIPETETLAPFSPVDFESMDRAELHFPDDKPRTLRPEDDLDDNGTEPSTQIDSISRSPNVESTAIPVRPPKIPQYERQTTPLESSRPIARKPITRGSISGGSSAAIVRDPRESRFLARPSNLGQPSTFTSTSMLFSSASHSLTTLTNDLSTSGMVDSQDNPPPYVEPPSNRSRTIGDIKREDSQAETGSPVEPLSTILLVRENRLELLRNAVGQSIGVDEVDPVTRRTAIMEAAGLRRFSASQILVQAGSRLHLKDLDGNTALHLAAWQGDADICGILLDAGAQLEEHNTAGDTPLQLAARGGHRDAVQCLLNSWTLRGSSGNALLKGFLDACKSGNVKTAEAFCERGLSPKKVKEAWRPIAYAAQSGSCPMIDFLISHKCNLKERSPDGWTALHFASSRGQTPVVEKLLEWKLSWKATTKKTEETALHLAILGGHSSTALSLIHHKDANITMKDADSMQPIHHAVRNGDLTLATTLLNRGAKIDDQNKYGWAPIHLAAAYGHLPLVAEFITRGVNIDEKLSWPAFKPSKKTNEAARKGYWAEIRWPNPAARPLHLSLEFGHDEVANVLIAAGAKIEDIDSVGWKALHYAAFSCRSRMVEMLLDRGSSAHTTTDHGNTPLSLGFRGPGLAASQEEREHVWELLQGTMNSRKRSKSQKFHGFMNAVSNGMNKNWDADMRNKAWHTAELAHALYQTWQGEDGEGEGDSQSQLTPSTSSQKVKEDDEDDDDPVEGGLEFYQPSSQITRTPTDK